MSAMADRLEKDGKIAIVSTELLVRAHRGG